MSDAPFCNYAKCVEPVESGFSLCRYHQIMVDNEASRVADLIINRQTIIDPEIETLRQRVQDLETENERLRERVAELDGDTVAHFISAVMEQIK